MASNQVKPLKFSSGGHKRKNTISKDKANAKLRRKAITILMNRKIKNGL